MSNTFKCSACGIVKPIAKRYVGKTIGSGIGSLLGVRLRGWKGMLIGAVGGAIAGHIVDIATAPVCSDCKA